MNPALGLLGIITPASLKKRLLRELYRATARAFGTGVPADLSRLSYARLLDSYAAFTKAEAEKLLAGEDQHAAAVREALYREARGLGGRLRKALRLRSLGDVLRASRILYAALRIDFEGAASGDVIIRACHFSRTYAPEICVIVSSIDAGVAAGLSGGGRLEFSQRITEGRDRCLARLTFEEPRP